MTSSADLKTTIRTAAHKAGFFDVRVSSASPVTEVGHIECWLSKKYNATMSYMERSPEARCDPASLLVGAKSVICAALEHKFGRGVDYHDVVSKKLSLICDALKAHVPLARFKTCVDMNPILEKAIAVRAGMGWRGKHSIVVHPEKGSFFVLGEVITDVEIEPDAPIDERCGDCRECIDACPTGAITQPYVVDANRCISYLTLEHKGSISRELTKYAKEGQDGCNICQEVCPHNQRRNL